MVHPCRAQDACALNCGSWSNLLTAGEGAFRRAPRHGQGIRAGSIQSAAQHDRWNPWASAPSPGLSTAKARITHPFLPTSGKEIDVIGRATHWGEERVVYLDDDCHVAVWNEMAAK